MELKTINGKKAKVTKITDVVLDKPVKVYNLDTKEYDDFILPGGVVVHNSNNINPEVLSCDGNCLVGKTKVTVYINGKTKEILISTLYNSLKNNPCKRFKILVLKNGKLEYVPITLEQLQYTGDIYKIRLFGGQTITLTRNHLVYVEEKIDGKIVKKLMHATDLRPGNKVSTVVGPKSIESIDKEDVKCRNVYRFKSNDIYTLNSNDGVYLSNRPIPKSTTSSERIIVDLTEYEGYDKHLHPGPNSYYTIPEQEARVLEEKLFNEAIDKGFNPSDPYASNHIESDAGKIIGYYVSGGDKYLVSTIRIYWEKVGDNYLAIHGYPIRS